MGTSGTWSPADLYHAALNAGFSPAESTVVTGTAAAESALGANRGPSSAGALGLFQFEPTTFYLNGVEPSSCTDVNNDQCQLMAFRNITKGRFQMAWYSNWFVNWDASAMGRFNDAVAAIGGIRSLPGGASQILTSTGVATDPSGAPGARGSAAGTGQGDTSGGNPVTNAGSAVVSGVKNAAGAVGNAIDCISDPVGCAKATAEGWAKGLLMWVILLGVGFIALVMFAKEIGGGKILEVATPEGAAATGASKVVQHHDPTGAQQAGAYQ